MAETRLLAPDPTPELLMIPVDSIDLDSNVRSDVGELDGLAASIGESGVIQPISVHRAGERFVLDVGHRRLAATRLAGRSHIPALVTADYAEGPARSVLQLVENIQRRDLGPLEEAQAFRAILEADPALTQKALAARIGKSQATVANALRLLELDEPVRAMLADGTLSAAHGKVLASLSPAKQTALAARVRDERLSSHELERVVGYELDAVKKQEANVARTKKAVAKALAVLAGTPKDLRIAVTVSWELDTTTVVQAIEKAGWSKATDQGWWMRDRKHTGCDCTAIRIEVNKDGAGLIPVCSDRAHMEAAQAAHDAARDIEGAAKAADQEALTLALTVALIRTPIESTVARLLLRQMQNYGGKTWTEYVAMPDAAVVAAIVGYLRRENYGAKPLPAKTVLKALAPTTDAVAIDPTDAAGAAGRVAAKRAARRAEAMA